MAIQQGWPKFLPLSWEWTPSCDQCRSLRACWSRLLCLLEQFSENTRWPEAPTAPLWDNTKFLKLGTQSAQQGCPSNHCWLSSTHSQRHGSVTVPAQCHCCLMMKLQPLKCPVWTGKMTHKRLQAKQEQCSHDRDPGTLSEMKKSRLSLFVSTYEKAGSCWWWCSGLVVFYRRTLQQKIWDNKAMSENHPWQTLLLPLYCLLPAVAAQGVLLWSWVNHHCANRSYWSHGSTERKKYMLLLI